MKRFVLLICISFMHLLRFSKFNFKVRCTISELSSAYLEVSTVQFSEIRLHVRSYHSN